MAKLHGKTTGRGTFRSDERGNFTVLAGFATAVLALCIGFALNIIQTVQVKNSLLHALDAAVTSTARDLTTGKVAAKDARALVEGFFQANSDTRFATQEGFVLQSVTVDTATRTVEATASAHVDLLFPLFSLRDPQLTVDSAAIYSDKTIEVSMVLDVTGSMQGQKIRDLKSAATQAVDTLLGGQDPAKPRVRMAIVPYADAVNAGTLANVVHVETSYTSGTTEPPRLDDPVSVAVAPDRCATERKGRNQFTDASPYTAKVNRDQRLGFCPTAALAPLTADASKLKSSINAFSAGGYTGGHTGIQWGWYMLSPQWRNVLPSSAAPAAYDPRKVGKIAVIMTDGEFNTAFAGVARNGDVHGQQNLSRDNAERLCEAMRREGIEIFTIGFMLKEQAAKGVMKACASDDTASVKHYFETNSGSELTAAFLEIARNIEKIAVTR